MLKNGWVLATASLLLGGSFDIAQASRTIAPVGSPFLAEYWTVEDGLPQSAVITIAQAHDGYLWLGTLNGLVRFDGVSFTVFDEAQTPGLNSSRIVHLFEDSRSNLWACTENAGVAMINKNGQIQNFDLGRGNPDGQVISSCEDADGVVWLLTGNGRLAHYQNQSLQVQAAGGKSLLAEKGGPLVLGADGGLWSAQKMQPGPTVFLPIANFNGRLDFLLASQKGGYWRLADGRIQKWQGRRLERDWGAYPWKANTLVRVACEDREGNLIVGTYGDGVYWFDATGKYTRLGARDLSHTSILSLVMDREGNLWVGTNGGGLNRVKRKAFGVLGGSEDSVLQSVCEDGEGGLWIGYNGDTIDHVQEGVSRRFGLIQNPQESQNAYVKSVFVDRDQQVWAGIWFLSDSRKFPARLFHFQDDKFQPVSEVTNQVSVIHQDRKGLLWVGGPDGLLCRDGHQWKTFTTRDGLPSNDVRALADDAEGNLWIGTGGGLTRLRDGRFTSLQKKDGLPSDDISALRLDDEGVLWVGTRGSGLARYQGNKWTQFTTSEGLIGNSIGYLLEDGEGNLWLGSNAGLMRLSKKSLGEFARSRTNAVVCRVYVEADGLPTRECTQGSQPAGCRTRDGKLWFPTAKGLVFVNPAVIKPNPYLPPVVIESIQVEGQEQNTNRLRAEPLDTIVIPPGKEHLEIRYTSLNLGGASRTSFRYWLEGHETGWNDVGSTRIARFSNLRPHRYRFQVAASNEDGVWNPVATVQIIKVLPPFWQTPWFLGIVGAVLLGLMVALVYFLSTQKLQRQLAVMRQQEALEKERARIARDLHDELGANLMQVALLGELAEGDKHVPAEVESHARQISQTARETTKALDEIVWAVNPLNDTLDGLITYVCKYAQEYFELAGLRYRLEVPTQLPAAPVAPEVRHNVFLAAKEAINNVVKHAQASAAWLRLRLDAERFTLEIEDNGRGLAGLDEKTGRNGLKNMRKRMEDVGGSFSISPAPEQGAVVRLSAPVRKN